MRHQPHPAMRNVYRLAAPGAQLPAASRPARTMATAAQTTEKVNGICEATPAWERRPLAGASKLPKGHTMSIQSVYDSYRHLGFMLENPNFASGFKNTMLHDMWIAISEEARRPQLAIDPDVLLDTAVLLEDEADEEHITTAIVYRRRAADFRAAAQQLLETQPTVVPCCSCGRSFPVGNMSAICERCREDKVV